MDYHRETGIMSQKQKLARFFKALDDGGFLTKEILKKGTGDDNPFLGCKVLYRFAILWDENDVCLSIQDAPPEITKLAGSGSLIRGLVYCLASMKKGERSLFTLTSMGFDDAFMENLLEVSQIHTN